MSDELVVFVGGCDRSGTTIVSRLIAEQLGLVMLPEAYFHAVAYRRFGRDVTAEVALRRLHTGAAEVGDSVRTIHGAMKPLGEFLRHAMTDIVGERRGSGAPLRATESTPENIEIGSLLLADFPQAHLVHVVRDPRAVTASLRDADFGPATIQECARLWKQRVASGLGIELAAPERVIRLRYEDLLADPGSLPNPLGAITPDPHHAWVAERDAMIDPTSRKYQANTLEPVRADRIESWRGKLTPREIGTVEFECRELMQVFGYEPDGVPDMRTSTQRLLNGARSNLRELTTGSLRRLLRVTRARMSDR